MVVQKTAFAFKIKNWLTRISIQYDTIKQPSVQRSVSWEYYNNIIAE